MNICACFKLPDLLINYFKFRNYGEICRIKSKPKKKLKSNKRKMKKNYLKLSLGILRREKTLTRQLYERRKSHQEILGETLFTQMKEISKKVPFMGKNQKNLISPMEELKEVLTREFFLGASIHLIRWGTLNEGYFCPILIRRTLRIKLRGQFQCYCKTSQQSICK